MIGTFGNEPRDFIGDLLSSVINAPGIGEALDFFSGEETTRRLRAEHAASQSTQEDSPYQTFKKGVKADAMGMLTPQSRGESAFNLLSFFPLGKALTSGKRTLEQVIREAIRKKPIWEKLERTGSAVAHPIRTSQAGSLARHEQISEEIANWMHETDGFRGMKQTHKDIMTIMTPEQQMDFRRWWHKQNERMKDLWGRYHKQYPSGWSAASRAAEKRTGNPVHREASQQYMDVVEHDMPGFTTLKVDDYANPAAKGVLNAKLYADKRGIPTPDLIGPVKNRRIAGTAAAAGLASAEAEPYINEELFNSMIARMFPDREGSTLESLSETIPGDVLLEMIRRWSDR